MKVINMHFPVVFFYMFLSFLGPFSTTVYRETPRKSVVRGHSKSGTYIVRPKGVINKTIIRTK